VPATWNATLDLRLRADGGRTTAARHHSGPLQVQKALYPEGDAVCHLILVHPPGGIAGGDALAIDACCEPQAHALLTTPGATRWYKANGRRATQSVRMEVGGRLEWLPQEAIVFDQAAVGSSIDVTLAPGAATIGWDVVVLGRTAAGETFTQGEFAQTIRLAAGADLLWLERVRIAGGDALLDSPIGLAGAPAFGCLWAYGPAWTDAQLDTLREALPRTAGVTRPAPRLLLARALGRTATAVRDVLQSVWQAARPLAFDGRAAVPPRIWAT
jgi:urease accessory protein